MTLSRDITQNEGVVRYLEQVCRHIRARDVHNDIRAELVGHLEELVDVMVTKEGLSEDQAIHRAIQQMGDPDQIGGQLHQVHKPRTEWGLIALIAVFIGIGLLAMYAVQLVVDERFSMIVSNTLLHVSIGVVVMIAFYFLDYRKLQRYSWHLYGFTIFLLLCAELRGHQVNGRSGWIYIGGYFIDVYSFTHYLFIIAIAGIILSSKRDVHKGMWRRAMLSVREAAVYFIVPGLLFVLGNAIPEFIVYCVVLLVLLIVTRRFELIGMGCVALVLLFYGMVTIKPMYFSLMMSRLSGYINPAASPDSAYMTMKSLSAIRSAGMWGQGLGAENPSLTYIYSDMLFTYLVYSLGWVAGIAIVTVVLMLAGRIAGIVTKLHDPYAKNIVIGLFSIIGVKFLWSIAMSVGLLPMTSMRLPFIGYGGTSTILEMAVIGVILSVYRRKDMIPRQAASTQS